MRILIVDDSKGMRMIVKRTLRQAGFDGHEIVEADGAAEALDIMRTEPLDFILTDWNMPDMSGLEMIQAMNAEDMRIKVGMITSRGSAEMRTQAQQAGAEFLLTKPFTPDTFRSVLEPVFA